MQIVFNTIQLVGGLILSFGYIPQILQIIRTKSVKDLNFKTIVLVFTGIMCMELYAMYIFTEGMMFLVTNSLSLVLAGLMCFLYKRYSK